MWICDDNVWLGVLGRCDRVVTGSGPMVGRVIHHWVLEHGPKSIISLWTGPRFLNKRLSLCMKMFAKCM